MRHTDAWFFKKMRLGKRKSKQTQKHVQDTFTQNMCRGDLGCVRPFIFCSVNLDACPQQGRNRKIRPQWRTWCLFMCFYILCNYRAAWWEVLLPHTGAPGSPELMLLSVWSFAFSPCDHLGFLRVSWSAAVPQNNTHQYCSSISQLWISSRYKSVCIGLKHGKFWLLARSSPVCIPFH